MDKEFLMSAGRHSLTPETDQPDRVAKTKRKSKNRSMILMRRREMMLAYVLLAPSLLLFGIFLFYPLLKSVYLSLFLTDPQGRVAEYVGMDNFKEILQSEKFYTSFMNTMIFIVLTVPVGIAVALLLAALTHNQLKGMKLFRFMFSLPMAVSVGTGSMIWMIMYHPTLGILNYFLQIVGLDSIQWLTDPRWAMLSVSLMTIWMNLGFNYILMLSGMQGVSDDIYDSARIDGSGPLRTFLQITMPLISPTLFFTFVVSIIGAFQAFGQINILTKGGPMNTTNVMVYNIYQDAFINFRFGIGSAQALILFAIILLLTIVQFKFVEKKVHYG